MELLFRRKHKRNHNADIFFDLRTGENYGITAIGKASAPSIYNLPAHLVDDYFEIEQYTGIQDIDKRTRIFVGDKVRVEWLADLGIEEIDCECVGVVKFHDGKFVVWFEPEFFQRVECEDIDGSYSMQFIELTSDHHDENTCLSFEVIGHIHEEVSGHAE